MNNVTHEHLFEKIEEVQAQTNAILRWGVVLVATVSLAVASGIYSIGVGIAKLEQRQTDYEIRRAEFVEILEGLNTRIGQGIKEAHAASQDRMRRHEDTRHLVYPSTSLMDNTGPN